MSLLKKAQTFISIFNEVRAKNEAQRQSSSNLNVALKNTAKMRAEMNATNILPKKNRHNGLNPWTWEFDGKY